MEPATLSAINSEHAAGIESRALGALFLFHPMGAVANSSWHFSAAVSCALTMMIISPSGFSPPGVLDTAVPSGSAFRELYLPVLFGMAMGVFTHRPFSWWFDLNTPAVARLQIESILWNKVSGRQRQRGSFGMVVALVFLLIGVVTIAFWLGLSPLIVIFSTQASTFLTIGVRARRQALVKQGIHPIMGERLKKVERRLYLIYVPLVMIAALLPPFVVYGIYWSALEATKKG